jgi:hypothetical protein
MQGSVVADLHEVLWLRGFCDAFDGAEVAFHLATPLAAEYAMVAAERLHVMIRRIRRAAQRLKDAVEALRR